MIQTSSIGRPAGVLLSSDALTTAVICSPFFDFEQSASNVLLSCMRVKRNGWQLCAQRMPMKNTIREGMALQARRKTIMMRRRPNYGD
jgi:hypothetical protein